MTSRARFGTTFAFVFVLVAGLCACASSSRSSRPPRTAQRFVAAGTTADSYASAVPEGPALLGPHALRVGRGLERAMASSGRTLEPDARLAELARMLLESLEPDGEPAPYAARELWTRHVGLAEPTPHVLVLTTGEPATIEQHTEEDLAQALPRLRYTHYGVATADAPGGAQVVIVLSWRWASLERLPRSVAVGTKLRVRGRLAPWMKDPQLVLTEPSGQSRRLAGQKGAVFDTEIVADAQGELRVELLASGEQGPTPVINVPVYVGMQPPTEITVRSAGDGDGVELDVEAFEQQLYALIDAERVRAGAPPLARDARLQAIGRAHGEDMRDHGFVGHTSPTTGTAPDRVARAGIRTGLVLENVGRGYTPEEVHQGLLDSPGHRANIVSPAATHVGVGAVIEREGERAAYLATEVFVRLGTEIDTDDAAEAVLERVAAARARRKQSPLKHEPALAELAARGASDLFANAGATQQTIVAAIAKQAGGRVRGYTRLATVMTLVSSLDEAAAIAELLDPAARAVGLGVAQGSRPDTIENAIAVVAIIAY